MNMKGILISVAVVIAALVVYNMWIAKRLQSYEAAYERIG
jgi:hypothetical protein